MQQILFSKQIMVGRSTMDTNKSNAAGIIFSRYILSIDNNAHLYLLLFCVIIYRPTCQKLVYWMQCMTNFSAFTRPKTNLYV